MAWLRLLGPSISPLLFLLWLTTSAVLIQEVVKGYKLLFIHTPVQLEQSEHRGEMSRASVTPFQNLFKCHPWKTDVGNQPHMCAHNLLSVSVTCVRGVWEVKCENWELSKETVKVAFGKAQGTLWVSLQKIKHRCVYSPWLPTWKQLWNKEGNFALCWFLSWLKTKLELNAVSPLAFLLVFCVWIGGLVSQFDSGKL